MKDWGYSQEIIDKMIQDLMAQGVIRHRRICSKCWPNDCGCYF